VNDSARVRRCKSIEHGQNNLDRSRWYHSTARREQFRERVTLQQVHHDERIALRRLAEIEDPDDCGVIQPGRYACLLQEPITGVFIDELGAKEL